ncbi:hypothetical protein Bca52824_079981 [Brassica carinata]|uniref:Uncharacterized protein n=1 Tax=Brassica carinata TaxID=52824 RepID=A0A8X7TZT6_BRACI|nr:hypothetical protein Bca52824_079981 [Brassica carinata]
MIVLLLASFSCFTSSEALTSSNGNITIKWDLMNWTPDGYVPTITETTLNSFTGMENELEMDQKRGDLEHGRCTNHKARRLFHVQRKQPSFLHK